MRNQRTGGIVPPVRTFYGRRLRGVAGALALAAAPLPFVSPSPAAAQVSPAMAGEGIEDFYRQRGERLLWLSQQSGDAAQQLVGLLETAPIDGLDSSRYKIKAINKALRSAWGGNPRAINRAERLISEAYVAYANDLRRAPDLGVYYVDPDLSPRAESPRRLLEAAAIAPSLQSFVTRMGWMNPVYGQLRSALAARGYASDAQARLLALNLERARHLPSGRGRYVVVNAAAQRLEMYQDGKRVGDMRVVVGKPKNQTPMMSAYIRFASLNPYWNVPPDLAAERIAPNVLKFGLGYLRNYRYEVLSDWGDNPTVVNASTIDWKAVADGRVEVRIRQLPGPKNSMGQMKFMFPNREGVYLHDTPDRELLSEASRLFSGGCVRLEDAPRLAEWMFGKPLRAEGAKPEQQAMLDNPVPVYITYLTAVPDGSSVAYFDDIYGRDAARMAAVGSNARVAR